jgi:hypothetical protein
VIPAPSSYRDEVGCASRRALRNRTEGNGIFDGDFEPAEPSEQLPN